LLTIEFVADGDATEVILTHEHLPEAFVSDHNAGWRSTLDHLSAYLHREPHTLLLGELS